MATITKKYVKFTLVWDKNVPDDLSWLVEVRAEAADDTKDAGIERIVAYGDPATITRVDFATKDGDDITTLMINKSTEILQALGSGAGTHTIVDDLG